MHSQIRRIDQFVFSLDRLIDELRLHNKPARIVEFRQLVDEAQHLAVPRGGYVELQVESVDNHSLVIGDSRFNSKILSSYLQPGDRVYPYLATCGSELHRWAESFDDLLLRYWADVIQEHALKAVYDDLLREISGKSTFLHLSSLSPGSIEDFPIQRQIPLFHLLHDVKKMLDVQLTDSLLMLPCKSLSGLFFKTETVFESCQLCRIEKCFRRRAGYSPRLQRALEDNRLNQPSGRNCLEK